MPYIEIDSGAIADNVRTMRERTDRDVIAVVKANAYGHGSLIAARAAQEGGASALATADIAEAIQLREAGFSGELIAWLHAADPYLGMAREHDITVGISNEQQLDRAGTATFGATPLAVHLKFDTGLGRNGIPRNEWRAMIERADSLQRHGRIRVTGLMSHLAGTDPAADRAQYEQFLEAARKAAYLEPERVHLSASSGSLQQLDADAICDTVRIGILVYGLHPDGADADGALAREIGVRPALRLTGRVEGGVLDVGYRHGLLPAPGAWVVVGGERVAVAEQHADHTVLERPVTGDAVVIGDPAAGEPGAGAWAQWADTINYEVVTRLSPHLERRERRLA